MDASTPPPPDLASPLPQGTKPSSAREGRRIGSIVGIALGFVVLAAAGAAAAIFFLGQGEASSARADVAAIGEEVAAQYEAGGEPVVLYSDGAYSIGATLLESNVTDQTLDFYPGAEDFCIVLTTSSGVSYSYDAATGAMDGSCAPAGTEPLDSTDIGTLDSSLTSSEYWFDLSIGDCVLDDTSIITEPSGSLSAPLSSPTIVPCTDSHVGEIYAIARIEGQDAPDDTAFRHHARELCEGAAFESYVGEPYFGSDLFYAVLYPTEESFSAGANEMVCILTTGSGETTGSLRSEVAE